MKLINPNNKTQFCFSLAAYPGNTGAKLHNTAYKILNLNYIYLPIRCKSNFKANNILKNLEFKGCSLSMPFKQSLTKKLDILDKIAKKTGSINTVLKKKANFTDLILIIMHYIEFLKKKRLIQKKRVSCF